ncbi:hypothetical protein [Prevotella pallens]|uniref:Virulence protein n=2 Tax=Prevotella pallens TaxID=60133 RepID=A0ABX9DS95_9BACT|nr:hypothetical protein [Prevotella pallens]EGQ14807.1 hypothetical protein HMPREF9144_2051 [Prevotella pallens ATCC 700821]RAS44296.1 hypothetical protein BC673_11725 [Prevotella pallens]
MNTEDEIKTKAAIRLDTGCSYFEWGNGMQVIRMGKGEVAMTEGELARFFRVIWRKVNARLRTITEESVLHPEERGADERKIVTDKEVRGYAPLYPLPTIIALSFQLDCVEAHLFRRHVCSELMRPRNALTPIIIYGKDVNN